MAERSSAYDAYLETYKRLTSQQKSDTPRDAAARVFEILSETKTMPLSALVDAAQISAAELGETLERLQNLGAINLTGSGLKQVVEITDKGRELRELFK